MQTLGDNSRRRAFIMATIACSAFALGCSDDAEPARPHGFGGSGGGGTGGTGATSGALCATEVRFKPEAGTAVSTAKLAGEWNDFELEKATELVGPDASGEFVGKVDLAPGFW